MKKKELAELIEERFAIQAQLLEHVYSRTANALQHIEHAIKELKNVNDGR